MILANERTDISLKTHLSLLWEKCHLDSIFLLLENDFITVSFIFIELYRQMPLRNVLNPYP